MRTWVTLEWLGGVTEVHSLPEGFAGEKCRGEKFRIQKFCEVFLHGFNDFRQIFLRVITIFQKISMRLWRKIKVLDPPEKNPRNFPPPFWEISPNISPAKCFPRYYYPVNPPPVGEISNSLRPSPHIFRQKWISGASYLAGWGVHTNTIVRNTCCSYCPKYMSSGFI